MTRPTKEEVDAAHAAAKDGNATQADAEMLGDEVLALREELAEANAWMARNDAFDALAKTSEQLIASMVKPRYSTESVDRLVRAMQAKRMAIEPGERHDAATVVDRALQDVRASRQPPLKPKEE